MNDVRLLNASEIECRVNMLTTDKNGATSCSLLLYKDARVDMRLLDETFGQMNWRRSHELIDGNLYCTISIWDAEKKEWVSKQDVGTESMTEKEKGQASDSFKRAGFNWGIGRELYTAPNIWVKLDSTEVSDRQGKKTTYAKFYVSDIGYSNEREINKLVVVDSKGKVRFTYGTNVKVEPPKQQPVQQESNNEEKELLAMACSDIKRATDINGLKAVYNEYKGLHKNAEFMAALAERKTAIRNGI